MTLGNVGAVFLFEWRRALAVSRLAWWAVLVLFPVFIVLMIRLTVHETIPREPWAVFLFVMVPMVTAMLGTFLWTTPAVSAELERGSWTYVAVRPGGRTALVLGKYLAAVTWVLPAALVALTASVILGRVGDPWRTWWAIARITCLSVPAYGAVYLVLGTLLTKRSMVVAVAYTLIFEIGVSMVPAVVNKFTVQYRLRALMVDWAGIQISHSDEAFATLRSLLGEAPAWWHVSVLVVYTAVCLVAALLLVRSREYSEAKASDV
jgi:ABC-type transport system involved in multi-copper enzyme maturation permease subunit